MSIHGAPALNVTGTGIRVVIVAASWHETIMSGLIGGATRALTSAGADCHLVRVPGSFELPVVCAAALANGADSVVGGGLGDGAEAGVGRGGTGRGAPPHSDSVAAAAPEGLTRVALDSGKPV